MMHALVKGLLKLSRVINIGMYTCNCSFDNCYCPYTTNIYLDSTIRCYTQLGNNYAINKQRILSAVISVVSNQYLVLTHMMEGQEIIVLLYLKKATI